MASAGARKPVRKNVRTAARICLAQCYCPLDHLIAHFMYKSREKWDHDHNHSAVPRLRHEMLQQISAEEITTECDICGSPISDWRFEAVRTNYKTTEEAEPYLKELEQKRLVKSFVYQILNRPPGSWSIELELSGIWQIPGILQIRPIPKALHGKNLRAVLPGTRWKKLRQSIIEERGLNCEICGKHVGQSKAINAHEEWTYDLSTHPATAKLKGIVLMCWHCHAAEHFFLTITMARKGELSADAAEATIEHFCRVNDVGPSEFIRHLQAAAEEADRWEGLDWQVDFGTHAPPDVKMNP
jgi:hypothetical protein